jgi:hypothetical protein
MTTMEHHPVGAGFVANQPSFTVAALGFVGSTLATATLMVLLSAL